jgi:transketolase C-terminal domain/subunit
VLAALPDEARARTTLIGVDRVPECGTNDEVLRAHGLDADSLAARVRAVTHA